MDPSALGTAIIGLDKVRHDQGRFDAAIDDREPIRQPRWRSRSHLARERTAQFLRRTADHIAPSPTPA